MKKIDDEILREQMQYIADTGRKAIDARLFIICTSFDNKSSDGACMMAIDHDAFDSNEQSAVEGIITLANSLSGVLNAIGNGRLKLIIRDQLEDKDIPVEALAKIREGF